MIERGRITEDEMVLEFLRAEKDSSRFHHMVQHGMAQLGLTVSLIDEANLLDANENQARKNLLDFFRGYERRVALFFGFPLDVAWRRVVLEEDDFRSLRYANHPTWCRLSDDTRLVSRGAQNFPLLPDDPELYQINGILKALRQGAHFAKLIAAEDNRGGLILIEGASRATAYLIDRKIQWVDALVASSSSMPGWHWY